MKQRHVSKRLQYRTSRWKIKCRSSENNVSNPWRFRRKWKSRNKKKWKNKNNKNTKKMRKPKTQILQTLQKVGSLHRDSLRIVLFIFVGIACIVDMFLLFVCFLDFFCFCSFSRVLLAFKGLQTNILYSLAPSMSQCGHIWQRVQKVHSGGLPCWKPKRRRTETGAAVLGLRQTLTPPRVRS